MRSEASIPTCPRCGAPLDRTLTAMGKVCFDCPSCGGRMVTLPVLKESLGATGTSCLARAAREARQPGCTCAGCGGTMSLLKVAVGEEKIEIDVCGQCLSVWCDSGEFDTLSSLPAEHGPHESEPVRDAVRRASPAAQRKLAEALADRQVDNVDLADYDLEDVLLDVARLVVGLPTLWRTVRPATPLGSILLTFTLPVTQFLFGRGTPAYSLFGSRYWPMDAVNAAHVGFDASSWPTILSWPFLQANGNSALFLGILLFPVLSLVERRHGSLRFLALLGSFFLMALATQSLALALGWTHGVMCGIIPLTMGFFAYSFQAFPNVTILKGMPFTAYASLGSAVHGLLHLFLGGSRDYLSLALLPLLANLVLGAFLGHRAAARTFRKSQNLPTSPV